MKSTAPKHPSKTVAIVTIHDVPKMTKAGRKQIEEWIHTVADDMEDLDAKYAEGRFTARYYAKE